MTLSENIKKRMGWRIGSFLGKIIAGLIVLVIIFAAFTYFSNSQKKVFWKSTPQGDFVKDDRNPRDVCINIQQENKLSSCKLLEAKASQDGKECVDGQSPSGCFACKFQC